MTEHFDIVVSGAGTSGIIAALTAARDGRRVALVESTDRLGGMAIYGLHRFVCGLFVADGTFPGEPLAGRVTVDFCTRLAGGNIEDKAVRRGRVWVLPFAGGAAFEACAEEQIARETGIVVYRRDRVERVSLAGGRIAEVGLASGALLRTDAVVDCTGAAAVCRLCGADVMRSAVPVLAGYGFEVEGVDERAGGPLGLSIGVPMLLRQAVGDGRLPAHLSFTTYETACEAGRAWLKMAVPSESAVIAKSQSEAVFTLLKASPAFRGARIRSFLPHVLPRETCHLRGAYVLTADDVLQAKTFADGVVRNAWPVEAWDAATGVSYRYLPVGQSHAIPRRCLRPLNGPSNLFCAGATISAEPLAAASIRVIGVCMALGEAAARQGMIGADADLLQ